VINQSSSALALSTTAVGYEHWFGIATNYVRTFGDMKVGVAGAYLRMEAGASQLNGAKDGKQFADDPEGFGLGLSVETGPFKVSIGYNETNDWLSTSVVSNSGSSWDVGARYTMGPHKIGIAYFTGAVEGNTTTVGEDESETVWVTHSFTVGPGVAWQNTIGWADWDGEGGNTAALDNDGWGFATHMKINF
jgi:predicted porin